MKKFELVALLFFVIPLPGKCEVLVLSEVLNSVDRSYPLISAAKQDVEKSQADYFSAKGGFDPLLKAAIQDTSLGYYKNTYYDLAVEQPTPLWGTKLITGYRKGTGNFPVYDTRFQTFDEGEARVGLELPILKGGLTDERRTRIQTNEMGVQIARQSLDSKKLEIKREVTKKYWDWVAAGKKLGVSEDLLNIALQRDQALVKRVQKGDAAQIDQTDNQRAVLQRQAAIIAAERSLQKSAIDLSLYYRDPEGKPKIPLKEQLPDHFPDYQNDDGINPTLNQLDEISLKHPDAQALTLQIEQLNYEQALARNMILPKLDLNVSFVKDFGVNPGTSYIPPSSYPYEFKVSVQFEVPLFLRSARGKSESVFFNQQKVEFVQSLTLDRLKALILDASQAITAARGRIEFAKQEVEVSKRLEEGERKKYQHGDSSLLIINLREQITRDAMFKEIEALSDYFKARVDFETYSNFQGIY